MDGRADDAGDRLDTSLAAVLSRISTRAAAPSLIEAELAAVIVPSFLNAGFRPGILSSLALKGCSALPITVSPPRPATVTGAISQANLPSVLARIARSVDETANASCASRVKAYLPTHCSANTPMALPRS